MPIFRELGHEEIAGILQRNHVGRVAFSFRDRVDIEPIHYVYRDRYLYCRTQGGSKLTTLAHHPWIAFEVDEVDGLFDWRSVVVHGTVYPVTRDGTPAERRAWEDAVGALRSLMPETITESDPVPFRDVLLRVHIDEVRGRSASPVP